MTLEWLIRNDEPLDSYDGVLLNNTVVMSVLPVKYASILKEATSITGVPIVRNYGIKAPSMNFVVHILETGAAVADRTFGLTDLDSFRRMQTGEDATGIGRYVWLRDTAGEYFLRHWKGGHFRGLDIDIKQGYNNIVTDTLYIVSFKFVCPLNLKNNHTLLRWVL